jgi:hypothetical protein
MAADLLYGNVLGQSPRFDWRQLRDTAGSQRWARMCDLALLVMRYSGQWGLPLANAGEFELLHWLVHFGEEEQYNERFEATKNLIEAASCLPSDGYLVELRRCLQEDQWLPGPWIVEGLDRLCSDILKEAQVAAEGTSAIPVQKTIAKPKTPRLTPFLKAAAAAAAWVMLNERRLENLKPRKLAGRIAVLLRSEPCEGVSEIGRDSKTLGELAAAMLDYYNRLAQKP